MIKSVITEYGMPWIFNRALYSIKLKMIRVSPLMENIFEEKVKVERLDLFRMEPRSIENFLIKLSDEDKEEIIGRRGFPQPLAGIRRAGIGMYGGSIQNPDP